MNPKLSVTEIALNVGFGVLASFYRTFASIVGMKPAVWRRQMVPLTNLLASDLGGHALR